MSGSKKEVTSSLPGVGSGRIQRRVDRRQEEERLREKKEKREEERERVGGKKPVTAEGSVQLSA